MARIKFEGFYEFKELLDELEKDFGPKDSKAILRKAMRNAMQPVLLAAKTLAPVNTGALQASLQVEARKPTRKDKRSKYVSNSDVAIAMVSTAPGYKLARTAFHNQKNTKSNIKQIGIKSDARATAMEFGTANVAAKPFLRPALESESATVISELSNSVKTEVERYKARQTRRAAKKG